MSEKQNNVLKLATKISMPSENIIVQKLRPNKEVFR
jgi:hypothetical protein